MYYPKYNQDYCKDDYPQEHTYKKDETSIINIYCDNCKKDKDDKKDDKRDDKKCDSKDKKDKKDDYCKMDKFAGIQEFRYDQRLFNPALPIPPAPAAPVPILTVDFDRINFGDRVWLSGIITFNNNNATFSTVTLTITRTSPIIGTPQVIYTQVFEIDNEGDDDQVQTPFSHVDVPSSQLFDVRYQVRVTVGNPNLVVGGPDAPNTFTAIRFGS